MRRHPLAVSLLLTVVLASLPADGYGQIRRPGSSGGWAPVEVGIHGGYEYTSRAYSVGGQLRIPLLPSSRIELVPNGDVVFLPQQKNYLAGAEIVAVSGGRRGGLYAGGGLTWRRAYYDGERDTRMSPTIVVGARSPAVLGSPLGTQIEVRWVRADSGVKPKFLSIGVNFPLWGRE